MVERCVSGCARAWLPVLAVLCAVLGGVARGDQAAIAPSADTALYQESNDLSNGAGDYLFAGRPLNPVLGARRSIIKFDIAGSIPAGSVINSVQLTMTKSRGRSQNLPVTLHAVLADWGEGASNADGEEGGGGPAAQNDATWAYRFYNAADPLASPAWATPGGDFDPVASGSALVGFPGEEGPVTWSDAAMALDVQQWLDLPATNFGWLVLSEEANPGTSVRFNARTHFDPGTRPMLVVDFTPPGATGACNLPDGTCVIDTAGNCAAAGGSYQGDGTSCPDGTGACCSGPGNCDIASAVECAALGGVYQGDGTDCASAGCPVVLEPYVDELPIMPIAQPIVGQPGGSATYTIPIVQTEQQLHRDLPPTTLWTYNGQYPGPTFEARSGEPIVVNWLNELRDETGELRTTHLMPIDPCPHGAEDNAKTVIHLHGGHVPAEFDGYPEDTFLPGFSKRDEWPMNQQAATLWYHDHSLGQTRVNVYLGLAGAFLIRDDFEDSLGLPSGEFEVPLIVQDRSFNADGSLDYPAEWVHQFFADYNVVNGKVAPYMNVKRATYRFRVVNGANSRTYRFKLSNGRAFQVIGTDGGLLEAPETVREIIVASAERADLLIDFSRLAPGTEVELINDAPSPFPGNEGSGVVREVVKFIVGEETGPVYTAPEAFEPLDFPAEEDAALSRDLMIMQGPDDCTGSIWTINGLHWDHITERPILGSTEIWRFINPTGSVHPMHMHLVFFQVLDRIPFELVDGKPVPTGGPLPLTPLERGWKDTVQVNPGEMVRVIARFENYTGLFAYHCHILEHEDHEMMRQFEVITCPADFAAPFGVLDSADISDFIDAITAGDLVADMTGPMGMPDGVLDFFDMLEFLRVYDVGCESSRHIEPGAGHKPATGHGMGDGHGMGAPSMNMGGPSNAGGMDGMPGGR